MHSPAQLARSVGKPRAAKCVRGRRGYMVVGRSVAVTRSSGCSALLVLGKYASCRLPLRTGVLRGSGGSCPSNAFSELRALAALFARADII